ncbi:MULTISPECIES: DUF881 domain-containing protein [Clostridia]|uniref:DUF881 domain-containing protein n=1 Tax=Clostridium saudiense TaxID=1414720 RepID=A0ABS2FJK8_9CLOT|nr:MULTISPECIES: DUF881 domain-containing protein [Clostridiaceae]MBM6820544.1 DUF881 domain-containing protein [Clostridium saudiense]
MKNYRNKFFILIATILLGFLIVTNIGINETTGFLNLNSVEYKDAIEERNKLYDEITALSDDNYELSKKISSLDINGANDDENNERVIEHMKEQLSSYSDLAGTTEIKGPGIILTIYDGEYDINKDDQLEVDRRTLHSADAAMVLNDLKTAGAEGVAINNYRILNTTGLVCAWAFIRFEENGNEMEGSPFKFYAIGDPEQLEASLLTEGSHINRLIIRKLNITIEKFDEITLPAARKSIEPKFMERADN